MKTLISPIATREDLIAMIQNRDCLVSNLKTCVEEAVHDRAEALGYATRLLEHFVAQHFPHNPDWKPLPELIGVLTQLDNAITIARDYKEKLRAYEVSPSLPLQER